MVFVLIDLIILVTYTIIIGVAYSADDGLGAKNIINAENPKDVKGVSNFDGVLRHSDGLIILFCRYKKLSPDTTFMSVTQDLVISSLAFSMATRLYCRS